MSPQLSRRIRERNLIELHQVLTAGDFYIRLFAIFNILHFFATFQLLHEPLIYTSFYCVKLNCIQKEFKKSWKKNLNLKNRKSSSFANFINILCLNILYKSVLSSFSLVTIWLCNFFCTKYLCKSYSWNVDEIDWIFLELFLSCLASFVYLLFLLKMQTLQSL